MRLAKGASLRGYGPVIRTAGGVTTEDGKHSGAMSGKSRLSFMI
jgi:hypothetical protein